MAVAGRGQGGAGGVVAVGQVVLGRLGHPAGGDQPAELGRGLDGEGVGGQVLGVEGDRRRQAGRPGGGVLARPAVDEVEVEGRHPRRPQGGHRRPDPAGVVDPAEGGQDPVVEALGAHRDPGHPGPGQPVGHGRVDRLRVGLDGHLGVGRERQQRPQPVQHPGQVARRQQGRGPAPDEHAGDRRRHRAEGGRGRRRLGQQRGRVRPPQPLHPGVGDEVAVVAAGQAERHVHVHPEQARVDQRRGHRGRGGEDGRHRRQLSSVRRAATNASWGTSTRPICFIRRLPSFWRSSSLRLRVTSPP